ncbi:hypothetical protein GQ457_15G029590 [Hibiscus cannabinus]
MTTNKTNLSTSLKDLMFFTKLRSLFWLKSAKDEWTPNLDNWWDDPFSVSGNINVGRNSKVQCSPPVQGCAKFNVDGTSKGEAAGCGGVLRLEDGTVRALFSGPVEGSGSDFAELTAIKTALEVFAEAEWSEALHLVIETDSIVILNWLREWQQRPWIWWQILLEIDRMAKSIGNVQFVHVSKQVNTLAVCLAKEGLAPSLLFKVWW